MPRFMLRDLFWLLLAIGLLLGWWREHESIAPQLKTLRDEAYLWRTNAHTLADALKNAGLPIRQNADGPFEIPPPTVLTP